MHLRRSFALTMAAVTLATVGLSSCGFDYATDRAYTPAEGVSNRDGEVKVLSAVVVASQAGSGTFIASLANGSQDQDISMTDVTLTDDTATPPTFEPVVIKHGALVNLADPAADIKLTGDFKPGDFVNVSVKFDNGETADLKVNVVTNSGYYSDLDGPATEGSDSTDPAPAS